MTPKRVFLLTGLFVIITLFSTAYATIPKESQKQIPLRDEFAAKKNAETDVEPSKIKVQKFQIDEEGETRELNVAKVELTATVTQSDIKELIALSEKESFRISKIETIIEKDGEAETFGMSCGTGSTNTQNYELFTQMAEQLRKEYDLNEIPTISGVEFFASDEKVEKVQDLLNATMIDLNSK